MILKAQRERIRRDPKKRRKRRERVEAEVVKEVGKGLSQKLGESRSQCGSVSYLLICV